MLFICSLGSSYARANEFSVSFPDSNNPDGIYEGYDFEKEFSTLQNVSLNFNAFGQPGIYRYCDLNTFECRINTDDSELLWFFSRDLDNSFISGTQVITDSPLPYKIDLTSKSSFFLNGQGMLAIEFNGSGCGSCTIEIIRPPTLTMTDIELVVDGTVISTNLMSIWLLLLQ